MAELALSILTIAEIILCKADQKSWLAAMNDCWNYGGRPTSISAVTDQVNTGPDGAWTGDYLVAEKPGTH